MGRASLLAAAMAFVAGVSIVLSGCSGGGGSDGPRTTSQLLLITAEGVAEPLFELVNGAPVTPPVCPTVFLNSRIILTFGGPVTGATLPAGGLASGSINFVDAAGVPAIGLFTVEDDPSLPAGNQRRVVFTSPIPSNPNAPCATGLAPGASYSVNIAQGSITVNGQPLANQALGCFVTCGCPVSGLCSSPFFDASPGAPFVVSTTPPTSDPAPAPVAPASIINDTVQILISEALNPSGISLASVRLIDTSTGAQVAGSLVFFQAGTAGLGTQSRLDYVASSPLAGDRTYELVISSSVQDFNGNPIELVQGNPTGRRFFQTSPVTICPQPPFVETFDTTANLGIVSGALSWSGNGLLQAVFPLELTGTGADGPFNPPAGVTTLLDTNELVAGQSRQGIFNFTTVNIPATATVRIIGPYLARVRCQGAFTLDGTVSVSAGTGNPTLPGTPAYERGPEQGIQNNGGGTNCEAIGGAANAGGGIGGTGSGSTPPPGSPPTFQCTIRANEGEDGFGPTIDGALNPSGGANVSYAGGQGGDSGCFPAIPSLPGCTAGDVGGLGGAGGTSARIGEAGIPRMATVSCIPNPGVTQPIAQPSLVPPIMMPPITVQSAGSGGGGGGDHLDATGPPNNDDQGGGGGGGGGGLRITCVGAYAQSGAILAQGAQGGSAQTLGGAGGSGAGGEIWIQTFATVTIAPAAVMNVDGPVRLSPVQGNIGCSNQASGGGGDGLVQIEAGQGPPATVNFVLLPMPTASSGAVFSAPPFPFAGSITGVARSDPFYAGSMDVDYTSAVEVFNLGNAAGATLTIRYEGAQEAVNSTVQTPVFDPVSIKTMATGGGPITAANIDELDGYPFIWFVVEVSFPAPPATPSNAILPSVDTITINYSSSNGCP